VKVSLDRKVIYFDSADHTSPGIVRQKAFRRSPIAGLGGAWIGCSHCALYGSLACGYVKIRLRCSPQLGPFAELVQEESL
jgi:hypothetical protein